MKKDPFSRLSGLDQQLFQEHTPGLAQARHQHVVLGPVPALDRSH